jgi:DNA-binding NarL/FixJ family response regulator
MGSTVLIVDDHDGFRARARALLGAAGYSVVGEASDGASALRAVQDLAVVPTDVVHSLLAGGRPPNAV